MQPSPWALRGAGNPDDWAKMIKLDLEVPMRLTRRLSPAMVRSCGHERLMT